tara:strand:+ start:1621 stop:1893 length:273 start_codon:yes stop_codon:yes gene_type:complete
MTIANKKMIRVGNDYRAILLEANKENMALAMEMSSCARYHRRYVEGKGELYVATDECTPIIIDNIKIFDGTPDELDKLADGEPDKIKSVA